MHIFSGQVASYSEKNKVNESVSVASLVTLNLEAPAKLIMSNVHEIWWYTISND